MAAKRPGTLAAMKRAPGRKRDAQPTGIVGLE